MSLVELLENSTSADCEAKRIPRLKVVLRTEDGTEEEVWDGSKTTTTTKIPVVEDPTEEDDSEETFECDEEDEIEDSTEQEDIRTIVIQSDNPRAPDSPLSAQPMVLVQQRLKTYLRKRCSSQSLIVSSTNNNISSSNSSNNQKKSSSKDAAKALKKQLLKKSKQRRQLLQIAQPAAAIVKPSRWDSCDDRFKNLAAPTDLVSWIRMGKMGAAAAAEASQAGSSPEQEQQQQQPPCGSSPSSSSTTTSSNNSCAAAPSQPERRPSNYRAAVSSAAPTTSSEKNKLQLLDDISSWLRKDQQQTQQRARPPNRPTRQGSSDLDAVAIGGSLHTARTCSLVELSPTTAIFNRLNISPPRPHTPVAAAAALCCPPFPPRRRMSVANLEPQVPLSLDGDCYGSHFERLEDMSRSDSRIDYSPSTLTPKQKLQLIRKKNARLSELIKQNQQTDEGIPPPPPPPTQSSSLSPNSPSCLVLSKVNFSSDSNGCCRFSSSLTSPVKRPVRRPSEEKDIAEKKPLSVLEPQLPVRRPSEENEFSGNSRGVVEKKHPLPILDLTTPTVTTTKQQRAPVNRMPPVVTWSHVEEFCRTTGYATGSCSSASNKDLSDDASTNTFVSSSSESSFYETYKGLQQNQRFTPSRKVVRRSRRPKTGTVWQNTQTTVL